MASKQGYGADLKNYIDKSIRIKLNGNRHLAGILKGYDPFMNIVLEDTYLLENDYNINVPEEEKEKKLNVEKIKKEPGNEFIGTVMIRGNSIILWECLDKIPNK